MLIAKNADHVLLGFRALWLLSHVGPTVGRFVCGSGAVYFARSRWSDLNERLRGLLLTWIYVNGDHGSSERVTHICAYVLVYAYT